jgi:hypothetical protein
MRRNCDSHHSGTDNRKINATSTTQICADSAGPIEARACAVLLEVKTANAIGAGALTQTSAIVTPAQKVTRG